MDLYIVRHGEAASGANDAARRLTDHGRSEVEKIAQAMSQRGVSIRQIRHSGRARARETAEIIGSHLEPPAGVVAIAGIHPDDPVEPIALSLFGERESLMLVGHLPFVARMVAHLTAGSADRRSMNFPTATVACLRGEDDQWELVWSEGPS
ncbi:MAG: phosphohistidine phosphatase SixA [Deltaproteobacteria bacterium]|nr:phosphohistidine phosphatase SixA [Deltaproteobacteria bacterium]MBW2387830.1 phosphohistidine phosphatase SixA [Deltaproteobacteria bacterium]MBW2725658.1 phosphohistidine phosphatase SixA [Deltaproteobacteria bacterium]